MLAGKLTVITPFVPELQVALLTIVVNDTAVGGFNVTDVVSEQLVTLSVSVTL